MAHRVFSCGMWDLQLWHVNSWGFSGGSDGRESDCSAGDLDSIPGSDRSWRRKWLPTPVFLPGEFHGQRSLVGYSHGVTKRHDWATVPFTFMWTLGCSTWNLVPWPGIEPGPPVLGVQSLSHWPTREVPRVFFEVEPMDFLTRTWRCKWERNEDE